RHRLRRGHRGGDLDPAALLVAVHPGPGVPAVAVAVRAVRGRGQALTVLAACRGRGGLRGDRGGLLRVVGPLHRGAAADRLLRHHRPDLGVRGRHLAGPAAGRDRPGPPGLAAGPPVAAAGAGLGGPGGAGLHRCAAGGPAHVPGLDRPGPADGGGPGVPGRSAGFVEGTVLVALGIVLAQLLTRLVDTPIRRWGWANASPWRSAAVVGLVLVLALTPTVLSRSFIEQAQEAAEQRAGADNPGARVLDPDFTPHPDADPEAAPLPTEATLRDDRIALTEECTGEIAPDDESVAEHCTSTAAPEDAKVMVALGSSRLGQAVVPLIRPAEENGWKLIVIRRPGCQFVPGTMTYAGQEC